MKRMLLSFVLAGALIAATASVALANHQSHSSYPEVPAGKSPQPNPNKSKATHGAHGNPSQSANPEVPAGSSPEPN